MDSAGRVSKKAVHKRNLSALLEEQLLNGLSEMDCLQFLQQFGGSEESKGPALFEDFHTFLAREGCIDHPWLVGIGSNSGSLQPASDEDFIAYLARFNGIMDSGTISKLRQALEPPKQPQQYQSLTSPQGASYTRK